MIQKIPDWEKQFLLHRSTSY